MLSSINGPVVGALLVGLGAGCEITRFALEGGHAGSQTLMVVAAVTLLTGLLVLRLPDATPPDAFRERRGKNAVDSSTGE